MSDAIWQTKFVEICRNHVCPVNVLRQISTKINLADSTITVYCFALLSRQMENGFDWNRIENLVQSSPMFHITEQDLILIRNILKFVEIVSNPTKFDKISTNFDKFRDIPDQN